MRNCRSLRFGQLTFACAFLLWAACPASAEDGEAIEVQVPGITRIDSTVPVPVPQWATLERRLIDTLSEAAIQYTNRYTTSSGALIWKTTGTASLDDLPESFYNFPLLYALGGEERLRELSFREYNATLRQLTYDFHILDNGFGTHGDWFHFGEGMQLFNLLALVDPTNHETVTSAKRFADLYMDPPNYDPKLKLIVSPETGSLGPLFGDPAKAHPYEWSKGMATYGLPLEDVQGITTVEDLKDPAKALSMGRAMAERTLRGDTVANLAVTGLVANAYILTGEQKYADWVKGYVDGWLKRTRENGGITPDNVGLDGKVGEYQNGKWWGGYYGWHFPHGYYSVGMALQVGAASAVLVSSGNSQYQELPRSNMDHLIAMGKNVNGSFVVPFKKGDRGWYDFQPIDLSFPTSLWFLSQDHADWQRLEKLRLASTVDWNIATHSPYPNEGYKVLPEPSEDCQNCDVYGLADWNVVADVRDKEDRSHEGPWLRFLAGANPDYPEKIMTESFGQIAWKMDEIRRNVLLLEYDLRGTTKIDPEQAKLTNVHEHHWQTINPVTTEALIQLTLGAPQLIYNGGLLHATLRYFDPVRSRPGLPPDVAALVTKIEADRAVVQLVNINPFEPRDVIVQAGTFGEHQFTRVNYQVRTSPGSLQPSHFARAPIRVADRFVDVNRRFFLVHLEPGTGQTLEMGMKRFVNRPTYAFPWQSDTIPVADR
jgi:hypothetical protein